MIAVQALIARCFDYRVFLTVFWFYAAGQTIRLDLAVNLGTFILLAFLSATNDIPLTDTTWKG